MLLMQEWCFYSFSADDGFEISNKEHLSFVLNEVKNSHFPSVTPKLDAQHCQNGRATGFGLPKDASHAHDVYNVCIANACNMT